MVKTFYHSVSKLNHYVSIFTSGKYFLSAYRRKMAKTDIERVFYRLSI